MSRKNLIILVAACIVSLGIGVVIGGGLKENNLSATGVNQVKPVQDATVEFDPGAVADEIESVKKTIAALKDEVDAKKNISEEKRARAQSVSAVLADLSVIVKSTKSKEMTQAIYDMCRELDIDTSCKPGDILDRRQWKGIESVIDNELDLLYQEAGIADSDLQSVTKEYNRALNLLENLMKLYDSMMKYPQASNGT